MLLEIALSNCINITYVGSNIEDYRWINIVKEDPYGISNINKEQLQVPYLDPPVGGYDYSPADQSPYYWDDEDYEGNPRTNINHSANRGEKFKRFTDCPTDYRLKENETVEFITCLYNTKHKQVMKCVEWALPSGKKPKIILRDGDASLPLLLEQELMPK